MKKRPAESRKKLHVPQVETSQAKLQDQRKKTSGKNLPEKRVSFLKVRNYLWLRFKKAPKRILSLLVLVILLSAVIINMLTDSSLSANFADSVMRPLIGSQNTIFLESIYFNATDLVTRVLYKVAPPKYQLDDDFTSLPSSHLAVATQSSVMQLTPLDVTGLDKTPLKGEGQWIPITFSLNQSETLLAKTFVRPDPERPFAIVSLVKANMRKLHLSAVAGTQEPGGAIGNKGPGMVPSEIQVSNLLVAAFNGGFQARDGQYGMMVNGKTYLPLKVGLATLTIDQGSKLKILNYQGQKLGNNIVVARQNGNMLVENSQVIPLPTDNQYSIWGRTITNNMYTWRSGIGITKDGDLIYAAGPSLIPETLAQSLLEAGAVNAMQLDINPYWVRFVIFNSLGNGRYRHSALLKDMYDGGEQFLHGYQKDFFYLYKE